LDQLLKLVSLKVTERQIENLQDLRDALAQMLKDNPEADIIITDQAMLSAGSVINVLFQIQSIARELTGKEIPLARIKIVAFAAEPKGLARLLKEYPEVKLYTIGSVKVIAESQGKVGAEFGDRLFAQGLQLQERAEMVGFTQYSWDPELLNSIKFPEVLELILKLIKRKGATSYTAVMEGASIREANIVLRRADIDGQRMSWSMPREATKAIEDVKPLLPQGSYVIALRVKVNEPAEVFLILPSILAALKLKIRLFILSLKKKDKEVTVKLHISVASASLGELTTYYEKLYLADKEGSVFYGLIMQPEVGIVWQRVLVKLGVGVLEQRFVSWLKRNISNLPLLGNSLKSAFVFSIDGRIAHDERGFTVFNYMAHQSAGEVIRKAGNLLERFALALFLSLQMIILFAVMIYVAYPFGYAYSISQKSLGVRQGRFFKQLIFIPSAGAHLERARITLLIKEMFNIILIWAGIAWEGIPLARAKKADVQDYELSPLRNISVKIKGQEIRVGTKDFPDKEFMVVIKDYAKVPGSRVTVAVNSLGDDRDALALILLLGGLRFYGSGHISLRLVGAEQIEKEDGLSLRLANGEEIEEGMLWIRLLYFLADTVFCAKELLSNPLPGKPGKMPQDARTFIQRIAFIQGRFRGDSKQVKKELEQIEEATRISIKGKKPADYSFDWEQLREFSGANTLLIHSTENSVNIIKLLLTLIAMSMVGAQNVVDFNSYEGFARNDRASAPGEVVSAGELLKVIGRILDSINPEMALHAAPNVHWARDGGMGGLPERGEVSLSAYSAFKMFNMNGFVRLAEGIIFDRIIPEIEKEIKLKLNETDKIIIGNAILEHLKAHPVLLVVPDAGAAPILFEARKIIEWDIERYMLKKYEIVVTAEGCVSAVNARKKRITGYFTETEMELWNEDGTILQPRQRFSRVLVKDDEISTGGTIRAFLAMLYDEFGYAKEEVYLAFVHMKAADYNSAFGGLIPVENIFATDSLPSPVWMLKGNVISLAPLFVHTVKRFAGGQPSSGLRIAGRIVFYFRIVVFLVAIGFLARLIYIPDGLITNIIGAYELYAIVAILVALNSFSSILRKYAIAIDKNIVLDMQRYADILWLIGLFIALNFQFFMELVLGISIPVLFVAALWDVIIIYLTFSYLITCYWGSAERFNSYTDLSLLGLNWWYIFRSRLSSFVMPQWVCNRLDLFRLRFLSTRKSFIINGILSKTILASQSAGRAILLTVDLELPLFLSLTLAWPLIISLGINLHTFAWEGLLGVVAAGLCLSYLFKEFIFRTLLRKFYFSFIEKELTAMPAGKENIRKFWQVFNAIVNSRLGVRRDAMSELEFYARFLPTALDIGHFTNFVYGVVKSQRKLAAEELKSGREITWVRYLLIGLLEHEVNHGYMLEEKKRYVEERILDIERLPAHKSTKPDSLTANMRRREEKSGISKGDANSTLAMLHSNNPKDNSLGIAYWFSLLTGSMPTHFLGHISMGLVCYPFGFRFEGLNIKDALKGTERIRGPPTAVKLVKLSGILLNMIAVALGLGILLNGFFSAPLFLFTLSNIAFVFIELHLGFKYKTGE
ncbi:MAG: hypothetical protein COV73_01310, partial [Candidatus Omnitrophica bacterium CG11_big_fil_rev_8_21_14_0_20_43_6]